MGLFLDKMEIDEYGKLHPHNQKIEERWRKIGLLEGLDKQDCWIVAYYFEALLRYMQSYDRSEIMTNDKEYDTIEYHLFPIMRRLFSDGELNITFFLKGREYNSYIEEIKNYVDNDEKTFDDIEIFMQSVETFIPQFIDDYVTWRELPKTLDTRIILAHSDDSEASLVAWYCTTFNIDRILTKNQNNAH